jgi:hypothetical protein
LFAYVASLNVARRARNEGIDDGRYSAVGGSGGGGVAGDAKGRALRVRDAARARIAVRWGVLLERDAKCGFVCLGLTPYLASVAYNDRPVVCVCAFFAGGRASTAASSDWNASASFLFVAVALAGGTIASVIALVDADGVLVVVLIVVQKREWKLT